MLSKFSSNNERKKPEAKLDKVHCADISVWGQTI